ncbi:hypothetical protein, partial [Salmonella enterica]|uniref:hypothetical protein n=1 Tax=Salmonella enterica TaxID=28901 RepID=UPI0035266F44
MDTDEAAGQFNAGSADVASILASIIARADSATGGIEAADTAADLQAIVNEWAQRSSDARANSRDLLY